METCMIKEASNMNLNHSSINSHSPTFLLHDGFPSSHQVSDIEMIKIQSVSYTSLKDLLSSPTADQTGISTPTIHDNKNNNSSYWSCWNEEIPIKNPLVKHAALAYLQPMSSPTATAEKGSFGGLKGMCCRESGCLFWLYDVVWSNVREAVWESREEDDSYEDDEDKVDLVQFVNMHFFHNYLEFFFPGFFYFLHDVLDRSLECNY
ncbi:uncharacterized protein LOC120134236 [Hibiscus syriacus]|uniref:uncharacterized protein LOC120134236 n=1 Tax=Hibiscus syriacus TaxID=106335 RepID=UPI001921A6C3|nr:uncharacterized protein LOC120134236 [Hibiscus syriacus]